LRLLAEALGLSHQRVQQIVASAGGSWWQKVWCTRNVQRDAVCTFCDTPPLEVSKLLAGPNVFICDTCVAGAQRAIAGSSPDALWSTGGKRRGAFCSQRAGKQLRVASGTAASICEECVGLCHQIMTDRVA
jgi:hypothetical protein